MCSFSVGGVTTQTMRSIGDQQRLLPLHHDLFGRWGVAELWVREGQAVWIRVPAPPGACVQHVFVLGGGPPGACRSGHVAKGLGRGGVDGVAACNMLSTPWQVSYLRRVGSRTGWCCVVSAPPKWRWGYLKNENRDKYKIHINKKKEESKYFPYVGRSVPRAPFHMLRWATGNGTGVLTPPPPPARCSPAGHDKIN